MTNRFDIYALVHKGLRAGLSGLIVRLGRTDWHNPVIAERTIDAAQDVLALCRAHFELEDRHIHPVLEAAHAGVTRQTATEHRAHGQEITGLEAALASLSEAGAAERPLEGAAFYKRWVLFAAENFEHMAFEEEHHNPVLWATFSDEQLRKLQQDAVAGLPEDIETSFRRWIMAAINSDERARIPPPPQMAVPPLVPAAA